MTGSNTPRSVVNTSTTITQRTSDSAYQGPHPHARHTHPPPSYPHHPSSYPTSAGMVETPYHPQNHHHLHHFHSSQSQNQDYFHQSSLPADSFPRTFPRSATYDQDRHLYQPPSPSSFTQPPRQSHYRLLQPPYPPPSSSNYDEQTSRKETNNGDTSNNLSNISSNLPEYSYPMGFPQNPHGAHHRNLHSQQYHAYQQERPRVYHPHDPHSQASYSQSNEHAYSQRQQLERRHTEPSDQQGLPVHSSRSNDSSRDYPSLHQNGSGHTMGSQQSINNRISPTTPRSTQVNVSVLRSLGEPYSFSESPIDFREPSGFRHSMFNSVHSKHGLKDHQIEPFSEQADIDELNSEDSEMDKYDGRESTYVKRQKMESEETDISLYGNMLPNLKRIHERNVEAFKNIKVDDEGEEMNAGDLQAVSSKRKQDGPRGVLREVLTTKGKKATKAPLQKRGLVPTLSLGENMDQTEDEVPVGAGNARGLRDYAQRVCKHVQEKGLTTHTELVRELCNSNAGGNASETSAHDKIGRRIYDALNVLEATGIITNDSKNIGWIGIEEAMVVKGITMVHPTHFVSNGLSGGGRDDESEEPEEDDMDIEQFEREIIAMRQRNEQEQAKLRDQLTRQVQLAGLVKRNKQNEAKKEERRRQRKEEKRRLRAIEDSSMADVKPHCSSDQNDEARPTSERHRRRRSPRHVSERTDGQTSGAGMDESDLVENEEARMRRKKESKERRERRAQRKLEKEKNRIHWPCVIVRMSGYTGQNSDSESNISVKRSIQIPSQSDENVESTDQETTIVDIAIQQQEELVIMSDSEILGDLGFNTLTIDELEDILPKEYIDAVQFTVNTEERVPSSEDDSDMAIENGARATTITVQGGFEREFVRGVSF